MNHLSTAWFSANAVALALIGGMTVLPDSTKFSTAVMGLANPINADPALTVQT